MAITFGQLRISHRAMLDAMRRSVGNEAYQEYWRNLTSSYVVQRAPIPAADFHDGRPKYVSWVEGSPGMTLEEVSKVIGPVTRERIRQIEAKALRKLRHPSRSNGLRDVALGTNAYRKPAKWVETHCGYRVSYTPDGACYCRCCGMPVRRGRR